MELAVDISTNGDGRIDGYYVALFDKQFSRFVA